ncbi:Plasmodium variant antigen protein Cir/Yir/Bir, putative, partial [Plasmodium chabaudi adami]
MSKGVCDAIDDIEKNIVFDQKNQKYTFNEILKAYCPSKKNGEKGQCDSDGELFGSAFIALLKNFESVDENKLESDKLAQYATLWFSYKIKENTKAGHGINDIYNTIIKNNSWFSEHSESIEKKKDMMKFHFIYLTNLYALLKGICETINKCNGSSNTNECI